MYSVPLDEYSLYPCFMSIPGNISGGRMFSPDLFKKDKNMDPRCF